MFIYYIKCFVLNGSFSACNQQKLGLGVTYTFLMSLVSVSAVQSSR